ncbi:hypothetical protein RchiOBHm_Chr4g0409941 [Rosa chinensis]|uniref:Uncharacterized protein n=1 Tax=Rosa chinensis TaxID=74649 RepID=A0A2P6QV88_ROSCH|nr:hypothetical protein RchiOBHm_Chr4g0409941 [Rosa chinensis]
MMDVALLLRPLEQPKLNPVATMSNSLEDIDLGGIKLTGKHEMMQWLFHPSMVFEN